MIGDAYFQLRAQVGTALFSLLRLSAETGAADGTLAPLRAAQAGLRDSFLFVALGTAGAGKSTLLNSLFDREFCGSAALATAGKTARYEFGEETRDETLSPGVVACRRPHSFLRDFTIVDAAAFGLPGAALLDDLAPSLAKADVLFFVISAAGPSGDIWEFLLRLGRDVLKRTILVVWQSDRVSADEGANAVKRLRQAMLKNLGHACPIFSASARDPGTREKLVRWIENEVIFSAPRRERLADLDRLAQEALCKIAEQPRAAEQAWQKIAGQFRRCREDLASREEQSQRQIAGTLWSLTQNFDFLRKRGESLLLLRLGLPGFLPDDGKWRAGWALEIETQARESLAALMEDALAALEADLRQAAKEHREAGRDLLPAPVERPPFSRMEIAAAIHRIETPLALEQVLVREGRRATHLLRLPVLAAVGAVAVLLGAWPVLGPVAGCVLLAASSTAVVLILSLLARRSIVAAFGQHYTANRTALLTAIELPLREAIDRFYTALAGPLDERIAAHAGLRQAHEPLLHRVEQLQLTFAKIAEELRVESTSGKPAEETA